MICINFLWPLQQITHTQWFQFSSVQFSRSVVSDSLRPHGLQHPRPPCPSVSYHFAFSHCSWGSQGKNTEVVCHSLLQWTTFCQTSPPWPAHLGWPHRAWLSFIELDKAVVLVWLDWLVFCDYGFSVCYHSEGQKSKMYLTGLKPRCQQALFFSGGSKIKSVFLLFWTWRKFLYSLANDPLPSSKLVMAGQ